MAAEHAGEKRRVTFGAVAQQGAPTGSLPATAAFLITQKISGDAFLSWGFTAERPNKTWVADFTCVATWAGIVYFRWGSRPTSVRSRCTMWPG